LACKQRTTGHLEMADSGSGQHHARNLRVGQQVVIRGAEQDAGILRARSFQGRRTVIAERAQRAEFEEIPGQVLAPVSMPYNSDVRAHGGLPFCKCSIDLPTVSLAE